MYSREITDTPHAILSSFSKSEINGFHLSPRHKRTQKIFFWPSIRNTASNFSTLWQLFCCSLNEYCINEHMLIRYLNACLHNSCEWCMIVSYVRRNPGQSRVSLGLCRSRSGSVGSDGRWCCEGSHTHLHSADPSEAIRFCQSDSSLRGHYTYTLHNEYTNIELLQMIINLQIIRFFLTNDKLVARSVIIQQNWATFNCCGWPFVILDKLDDNIKVFDQPTKFQL